MPFLRIALALAVVASCLLAFAKPARAADVAIDLYTIEQGSYLYHYCRKSAARFTIRWRSSSGNAKNRRGRRHVS